MADAFLFAFVDVFALPAVALESVDAHAAVAARFVPALAAQRRAVVFASFALVNVLRQVTPRSVDFKTALWL